MKDNTCTNVVSEVRESPFLVEELNTSLKSLLYYLTLSRIIL